MIFRKSARPAPSDPGKTSAREESCRTVTTAKGPGFILAVLTAALAGWALLEPFFKESVPRGEAALANVLYFPMITGLVAAAITGMLEAHSGRPAKIAGCIIGGFGAGFAATFLLVVPSQLVFDFVTSAASGTSAFGEKRLLAGMVGRSLSWSILAFPCGMAVGIVSRSWTRFIGCCCGALVGGVVGGSGFDLVSLFYGTNAEYVGIGRMIGFSLMAVVTAGIVFITETTDCRSEV